MHASPSRIGMPRVVGVTGRRAATTAMLFAICAMAHGGESPVSPTATPAHLVSLIDVKDFGSEYICIGDLNRDGAPDLLFAQSLRPTREITCLTATTITGQMLWQHGTPDARNGAIYSDLPVHVYDWDGDGATEVLYVRQARYAELHDPSSPVRERAKRYEGDATMIVLDGATGSEKRRLAIPAPADDCFLFADLTGRGRRQDFVVKDRYWNMWGVSAEGKTLWHYEGSVGHFPAYGDVDGDGRDEVFVGFALIDHDGRVLFEHPSQGHHQDAAYMVRLPDGSWRLLFGNHGIHCLDVTGKELWSHPLSEAQHVVAGHFRPDLGPVQFMVIDRGQPVPAGGRGPAMLYLYDLEGREVWRREQPAGSWAAACAEIDWSGAGEARELLIYGRGSQEPVALYDGDGKVVQTFAMRHTPDRSPADREAYYYCTRSDVWGDGRDEVILFGSRGACIYANARAWSRPTTYNNTLYPGM
jgi:outer membrane protein assembly factor BamB